MAALSRRAVLGATSVPALAPATAIEGIGEFASRADAARATPPGEFIRTAGYRLAGDGGGAMYRRVQAEPRHAGKFRAADGGWWELAEPSRRPEMFGAVGDGASDDTAAFNAALAAGPGEVLLAAKRYAITSIAIPNNVSLRGAGMGLGQNRRTELVCVGGAGPAVLYQGYYSHLEGVLLNYAGPPSSRQNVVGVRYGPTADGVQVTNTSMAYVTIVGFGVGIQNNKQITSFTHLHHRVYVKHNLVGVDMAKANNVVFDACCIDSNGVGARFDTFTNVVFSNGCVLHLFGDGRLSEANDSKLFVLSRGKGFVCRDFYAECGSRASSGTQVQLAQVSAVNGLTLEGGYLNRSAANQRPLIEFMDANSSAVSIRNNALLRGPGRGLDYLVDGATPEARDTLHGFDIANNAVKFTMLERPATFAPVLLEGGKPIQGVAYAASEAVCHTSGGLTHVSISIALSAIGRVGAGPLGIQLPVAMLAGQAKEAMGMLAAVGLGTPADGLTCLLDGGQAVLRLCRDLDAPLRAADLTPGTRMRLTITYPTARQAIGAKT